MPSKLKLTLFLAVLTINAVGQKKALKSISANDLKAHLEFIANDYMQGRNFGTEIPGLEITGDYLKSQCKKMVLKPGFEDFNQKFEMISVKPDTSNSIIQLYGENNKLLFESRGFTSDVSDLKNIDYEGKLVFGGYGWKDENTGYDDFNGIDVKDKMVLVMTRNREMALDTSKNEWVNEVEFSKADNVYGKGAKGIIFCADPQLNETNFYINARRDQSEYRYFLKNHNFKYSGQTITIMSNSLVDNILKIQGKSLVQIQKGINDSGKPNSFEMDQVRINFNLLKIIKSVEGKNVIGILEGSDPLLKNECLIFTAHYDHIGVNSKGEIYNGADDNGSGTVALLEIAEAFTKLKRPPKRSIVFAWVTAEEKGMCGSKYYSQHPVFPLEKTVVNINLDMIGRIAKKDSVLKWSVNNSLVDENGFYIISGKQSSELLKISDRICKKLNLVPSDSLTDAGLHRSDHYHFYKNGIPILGLTNGLHKDYHKPSDKIDKIDYNKMKRIAEYAFLVANKVANQKKRIVVDNPVSQEK
jgi:hypothetical protein